MSEADYRKRDSYMDLSRIVTDGDQNPPVVVVSNVRRSDPYPTLSAEERRERLLQTYSLMIKSTDSPSTSTDGQQIRETNWVTVMPPTGDLTSPTSPKVRPGSKRFSLYSLRVPGLTNKRTPPPTRPLPAIPAALRGSTEQTSVTLSPPDADDSSTSNASPDLQQRLKSRRVGKRWSSWRACADGGANRVYDLLRDDVTRSRFLPDIIKGDLDSLRSEVREFYTAKGIAIVCDDDQDSTDLMKCVSSLTELEQSKSQYELVILGGLSGRLDHTVHTLSFLHKLRTIRKRTFAVNDDNVGWVLDTGEHEIKIDLDVLGKTCGLLPVGIESTVLTTRGLRWNLTDRISSFDGMVSTSNVLQEPVVYVKTTAPIWWTVELKSIE